MSLYFTIHFVLVETLTKILCVEFPGYFLGLMQSFSTKDVVYTKYHNILVQKMSDVG